MYSAFAKPTLSPAPGTNDTENSTVSTGFVPTHSITALKHALKLEKCDCDIHEIQNIAVLPGGFNFDWANYTHAHAHNLHYKH